MIERVELENWRTHQKSVLEFSKGTNVLVGKLGSGKSSVMDAICFALYGTFPALNAKRLTLAETVMHKPSVQEFSRVKLDFSLEGKNYCLERSFFTDGKSGQAKLLQNSVIKAGPQPSNVNLEVEKLLGMDFELFSRAVYSEQNQLDFFLKLSPRERKKKFDDLLHLERYESARQNAVKLSGQCKTSFEEKERALKGMDAERWQKEAERLEEQIGKGTRKALEFENAEKEWKEKAGALEKEILQFGEKERQFQKLEAEKTKWFATAEQLNKQLSSYEREIGTPVSLLDPGIVAQEWSGLKEREQKALKDSLVFEEYVKRAAGLNAKQNLIAENLSVKRKAEPRPVSELEQSLAHIQLKGVEARNKREECRKKLSEAQNSSAQWSAQLLNIQQQLSQVASLKGNCPVCLQPIALEHSHNVKQELEKSLALAQSESENSKKMLESAQKEAQMFERTLEELEKEEQKIDRALGLALEVKDLSAQEEKCKTELQELNPLLSVMEKTASPFELQKVQERLKLAELKRKALEERKNWGEAQSRLNEVSSQSKALQFDPSQSRALQEALSKAQNEFSRAESGRNAELQMVAQVRESLQHVQRSLQQLQAMQSEVEEMKRLHQLLSVFANALEDTQGQLRTQLLEAINLAMQDLWPRLYPYQDFVSAKLEIVEGDYEFFCQSRSGKWTRVEGILSGGERTAAALTIRMAFSLVLTQKLGLLILDEPTHNLDQKAVRELAKLLKERLPELVEQVFVITHDPLMEEAASGTLYEMQRDKDLDGVSVPVKRNGN
ncbi:MAG: SMC family ATPase [Candidatus Diapherotrites archaeon]